MIKYSLYFLMTILIFQMGCKEENKAKESKPVTNVTKETRVKMITSMGDIVIALNAEKAPKTVENFLKYVDNGFYENTIFHRVIKSFMIQGGGLTEDMNKKETLPPIQNEADNGLKNDLGTIAMARTGDPHSATAQFFINAKNNAFLDHKGKNPQGWGYCVFGKVVEGLDIVRAIENSQTTQKAGRGDVPVTPIFIKKVERL